MVKPPHDDLPSSAAERSDAELELGPFETIDDDQGISLDELSQAYAELIGKGSDPYESPSNPAAGTEAPRVPDEPVPEDSSCELCPKSIVEAILFVGHPSNEALTADQLAAPHARRARPRSERSGR